MKFIKSHVSQSTAQDGKAVANWMNHCPAGKLYGHATISLVVVGKGHSGVHAASIAISPQMLKRYFPKLAQYRVLPAPKTKDGHAIPFAQTSHVCFSDPNRLRGCAKCGKFFFAAFKHQRFCSQKCQEYDYKSSPEWRAHRREYMRKLRATEKRRSEIEWRITRQQK